MKGLRIRRYLENKKATKRWEYFHGDPQKQHDNFIMWGFTPDKLPEVGRYRKSKGCECRGCTSRKETVKIKAAEERRTTDKKLPTEVES